MNTEQTHNDTNPPTPVEITIGHKHEMMDRTNVLANIFQTMIVDHPAASLLKKEIDEIGEKLGGLYQRAAQVYIDHE
jgi:hypothetical protein